MNETVKTLSDIGIVPVIAIDDASKAVDLAEALINGGLPAAEITFRTEAGQQAIRNIAENCPGIILGAGTVLSVEQADRAVDAGARYIVSPGYNDSVVDHCIKKGIPVLPGCANASDMTKAVNAGLDIVKFFPAEASGGIDYLKALAPVFPSLRFMPTGGISTKNLSKYLNYDRIIGCGGTWMVKKDLINGEKWDEITAICKDAVNTMLNYRIKHVGINFEDSSESDNTAEYLCSLFGLKMRPDTNTNWAGELIECLKFKGRGQNGHIAVQTDSVDRAEYRLRKKGIKFVEESRRVLPDGRTSFIYLKEEIAGFAFHLTL